MKELIRQDINEKPGGPFHRCPIREVVIGPEALDALAELLTPDSVSLVLAHLSSECNDREILTGMAEKTLANLGREDILLTVALQESPLETFWLAQEEF